jgi:iron complex transport system permease protein
MMLLLTGLLVVAVLAGLGLGAVRITPAQAAVMVLDHFSIGHNFTTAYSARESGVLFAIRLPRVVLGLLAGAALGISGAAVQGLFRNPLAAPGLIGISSGAALANRRCSSCSLVSGSRARAALPLWNGR